MYKKIFRHFGGDKSSTDLAHELRQNAEMVRDVSTW